MISTPSIFSAFPTMALAVCLCLAWPIPTSAQFVISEFMSVNDTTLNDEDGTNSDWIEIHNTGTAPANLAGWHLTDDPANLRQWMFPSTNVPPNSYLVVFASDKNRTEPGAPLHTNFRLSSDGEYLALIQPDGLTVASEFAPQFPRQIADVSFGPVRQTASIPLMEAGAPVRAWVPTDDRYGSAWTAVEFEDSAWDSGTTGVGYDRIPFGVDYLPLLGINVESAMYNLQGSVYLRLPFVVNDPTAFSGLELSMRFEDGFAAYLNGIEVAASNAPADLEWNSLALGPRTDLAATNAVLFDLAAFRDLLQTGTNVLAIHGLNSPLNSPDLLMLPELNALAPDGPVTMRYFPEPTPGAPNGSGVENVGPIFSQVQHQPQVPNDASDIAVTVRVRPSFTPIGSVRLHYRVMFGPETVLDMGDDGAHGDGAAGDGVYGAVIPANASLPSQMVRWYFTGLDATGEYASRFPAASRPDGAEYFGAVIEDPTVDSSLPVYHWFVQNTAATDTTAGTRCSVYYMGQFYDNVFCRVRGASAPSFPKKPYKFDFNPGDHFRFLPGEPRMDEINLNTTFQDKAHLRAPLSFETYRRAGAPAVDAFNVRVQRNGAFYSVAALTEQVDETFLERRNLDPNGALYKMFNGMTSASSGVEKKTRRHESNADLQELIQAVSSSNPNRELELFDRLDLPKIVNYLAAGTVAQDWDRAIKNLYVYRDTEGDGLWSMLPWDKDLSFGKAALVSDVVVADKDGGPKVGSAENDISHPFYGTTEYNCCGANQLIDAVYKSPVTRSMYLRRLRTLMDAWLQPPGTPEPALFFESRLEALQPLLAPAAALDLSRWGAGYGQLQNLDTALNFLRQDYLASRRIHLYETHSVDNLGIYADAVGIPHAQTGTPTLQFGQVEANPPSRRQSEEYVQLLNPNPLAVDISGWSLEGGIEFAFAPGTVVPAQNAIYISPHVPAFLQRSEAPRGGQGHFVVGPFNGQLSARGETLTLRDAQGETVATHTFPGNPSPAQQFLRISELMYHPAPPPAPAARDAQDYEFIELFNISTNTTVSLEGIRFTDGVDFDFTGGGISQLAPQERVILVRDASAFEERYGTDFPLAGAYAGALNNGGERLRLLDANQEEILDFEYDNQWFPVTDGQGFSLVVADPLAEPDAWNRRANWRPSGSYHGRPNLPKIPPAAPPNVVIHEVLSRTDTAPPTDSVELFNASPDPVDLGGWFLSDDLHEPYKYRIPDGTVLPSQGYLVFDEDDFNPGGTGFAFSSLGDDVWLFAATSGGVLTGYAHGFSYGASLDGVSFGRHLSSTGEEQFVPQSSRTLGNANAGPRVGPVVISEIMYHPENRPPAGAPDALSILLGRPAEGTPADEPERALEYLELRNLTGQPIPLFDSLAPANTWRLRGGVDFDFPPGLILPANGVLVLVGFDPADDAASLIEFEAAYGPGLDGLLVGPWEGQLANNGETIELQQPLTVIEGEVPYWVVDRVGYQDAAPWPHLADGLGSSLQKADLNSHGDDPAHWFAAGLTPGEDNLLNVAPQITLLSPTNGAHFAQGQTVPVTVEATDADGTVPLVEIYEGTNLLATLENPPYTFNWSAATFGSHRLHARAIDNLLAASYSQTNRFTVEAQPPTVALTSPSNGSQLLASPPILLSASATDADGFIERVEFFDGPIKLGEAELAPYQFLWEDASPGPHTLSVSATDNSGNRAFSDPVQVEVRAGFATNQTLIATGAVWKYFDLGIAPPVHWTDPDWDDAAWPAGPAPLGYGDGDEATVVSFGPNDQNKYITTYFRRSFTVSGASAYRDLNVEILRDDGAIVYLNGMEIFRTGMPPGPVDHLTLASITVVGDDERINFFGNPVDSALLREGRNTVAVEIHQTLPTSSDISFDLTLAGSQSFFAPVILSQSGSQSVEEGETITLQVTAEGTAPLTYQWHFQGQPIPGATQAGLSLPSLTSDQSGAYTVRVQNSAGEAFSEAIYLIVLGPGGYADAILADAPLHFYRFAESSTSQPAADEGIPGDRPGTYTGGIELNQPTAPLNLAPAAYFNGSDGTFVDLGLFHPGDTITVEAWVWLEPDARASSYHAIVARWDGSFELDIATDDRANLVVRNQDNVFGLVASAQPLPRGVWHHLAGSYHEGTLSIYVNGTLSATEPLPGTLGNNGPTPDRVLIGGTRSGNGSSFNWQGWIDEVAIYDRALPAERIHAHYQAGLPRRRLRLEPDGTLSWPAIPSGMVLQDSESLGPNASWQSNDAPREQADGFYRIILPMNGPQRFYRLIQP